ncbi:hypothetical protein PTSG_03424 [Salpingoeca rosetta]|uniref:IRS-type PTB domain-containing protein n=1 Tax=Salpingoeca rosetta (strain ATCC 50818 / BSB-021) TaxID=946362 RepID=F2U558_SALR5|nr:uncharacterized protein PTSG_03424 [Salpingoeca rosetta]EGD82774.1 hypothetical protein PTSG_03424 [Salpingoeca rosetta]|eukprot:XP_004996010.1 hypothetical protein PTSG_03424 [Salpingoeca rosetta]
MAFRPLDVFLATAAAKPYPSSVASKPQPQPKSSAPVFSHPPPPYPGPASQRKSDVFSSAAALVRAATPELEPAFDMSDHEDAGMKHAAATSSAYPLNANDSGICVHHVKDCDPSHVDSHKTCSSSSASSPCSDSDTQDMGSPTPPRTKRTPFEADVEALSDMLLHLQSSPPRSTVPETPRSEIDEEEEADMELYATLLDVQSSQLVRRMNNSSSSSIGSSSSNHHHNDTPDRPSSPLASPARANPATSPSRVARRTASPHHHHHHHKPDAGKSTGSINNGNTNSPSHQQPAAASTTMPLTVHDSAYNHHHHHHHQQVHQHQHQQHHHRHRHRRRSPKGSTSSGGGGSSSSSGDDGTGQREREARRQAHKKLKKEKRAKEKRRSKAHHDMLTMPLPADPREQHMVEMTARQQRNARHQSRLFVSPTPRHSPHHHHRQHHRQDARVHGGRKSGGGRAHKHLSVNTLVASCDPGLCHPVMPVTHPTTVHVMQPRDRRHSHPTDSSAAPVMMTRMTAAQQPPTVRAVTAVRPPHATSSSSSSSSRYHSFVVLVTPTSTTNALGLNGTFIAQCREHNLVLLTPHSHNLVWEVKYNEIKRFSVERTLHTLSLEVGRVHKSYFGLYCFKTQQYDAFFQTLHRFIDAK